MASNKAKTLNTEANQKVESGKKRKCPSSEFDLFTYDNQIELTFSHSTKSAKVPINIDSSDDEDDDNYGGDDDDQEFKRIHIDDGEEDDEIMDDSLNDDSHEIQTLDSEDSGMDKSVNVSYKSSPSPPPPPPSQAELLRVQRQLKAKNRTRADFDSAFYSLKEAVAADISSPITPPVSRSSKVILLDDCDTPVLSRNSADRKVVVKVRTSSGIKKFNMKAGDKFEFIINELSKTQNVDVGNILLSLNDVNIMPDDTPLSKNVTVADIIECVIMDSSGAVEEEDFIEIKVQGNTAASRKTFKVSKNQQLEKVFKEYSEFRKLPRSQLKFLFDGDPLEGNETPVDLDMEDEDVIDVREVLA